MSLDNNQRKQARRARALARFHIDKERAAMDPVYKRRKEIELESLKKSLRVT